MELPRSFLRLGSDIRDFKIQRRGRQRERRLNSEFAFFQSLQRLFLPTYFVKCRRTLLKLNFKWPYSSSEREIKFRRCLFTSSLKREIRHFHVEVVQENRKEMYKKAWSTCKAVVLLIKPFAFWRSRCRPRRWVLKSQLFRGKIKDSYPVEKRRTLREDWGHIKVRPFPWVPARLNLTPIFSHPQNT